LLGHRLLRDAKSRQYPAQHDARGTLDVIVERRQPLRVALLQQERAVLVKVLPLQDGAREHLADAAHEGFDEIVIVAAAQAPLRVAEVQRVRE
jgi:hypothetical protein